MQTLACYKAQKFSNSVGRTTPPRTMYGHYWSRSCDFLMCGLLFESNHSNSRWSDSFTVLVF